MVPGVLQNIPNSIRGTSMHKIKQAHAAMADEVGEEQVLQRERTEHHGNGMGPLYTGHGRGASWGHWSTSSVETKGKTMWLLHRPEER